MVLNRISVTTLRNLAALSAFFVAAGVRWDSWWHVAIGRDSFWIPPHALEYLSNAFLGLAVLGLYLKTKKSAYSRFFLGVMVTFVAAGWDVMWHIWFGKEEMFNFWVIWSPPHILGFLGAGYAISQIFWISLKEYNQNPEQRDSLSFFRITLLSITLFSFLRALIYPIEPLAWHHVLGFYGSFFSFGITILYLFFLIDSLPKTGIVFFTVIPFLLFVGFEARTVSPLIHVPPHSLAPQWLHFLSVASGILILDFIKIRPGRYAILGFILGIVAEFWYVMFWQFVVQGDFMFPVTEGVKMLVMAGIGGYLFGLIYDKFIRVHIQKSFT